MKTNHPSLEQDVQAPLGALNLQGLKTADYLKAEPKLTDEQKSALASYLAMGLNAKGGRAEEFVHAEAILRLIAWNAEPPIIEAMARAAAANPAAPRSLIWALANDDEAAAAYVLEISDALSDADLVAITQSTEHLSKLSAIARRPAVSAEVSRSLAQHGNETTLQTLLANTNADIPEDAYGFALDRFSQDERILEGIIDREAISPSIEHRLSASVRSARLAQKLADRHPNPPAPTPELASASVRLPGFTEELSDEAWENRLSQMIAEKSITASSLVRHLCLGNYDFFARALSALTTSPIDEVRARLMDSPTTLLPELWKKASLPSDWLPVAIAALSALIQVDRSASTPDRQLFSRNIIARTLANLKAEKVVLSSAQRRFFAQPGMR